MVVGVNRFTVAEEDHYEPLRLDPTIGDAQCARLVTLRAERDQAAVDTALEALREAARGTDNVLYPMREALKAHATVGEVSDALREVWGLYTPGRRLLTRRPSSPAASRSATARSLPLGLDRSAPFTWVTERLRVVLRTGSWAGRTPCGTRVGGVNAPVLRPERMEGVLPC